MTLILGNGTSEKKANATFLPPLLPDSVIYSRSVCLCECVCKRKWKQIYTASWQDNNGVVIWKRTANRHSILRTKKAVLLNLFSTAANYLYDTLHSTRFVALLLCFAHIFFLHSLQNGTKRFRAIATINNETRQKISVNKIVLAHNGIRSKKWNVWFSMDECPNLFWSL